MAPMTGGIADAKEDWFVFGIGFIKGFLSPRVPIYGVMGMLQEIRTFLVYKSIGFIVSFHGHHLLYNQ